MEYISVTFVFLLFVCIAQCQVNFNGKQMRMSRFDAQQKLDEHHLIPSSLNKEMTMKTNPTRAQLHQCIAACTVIQDFSNSVILSPNCSRRISSYACMMDITLFYDRSSYQIDFLTTGSENDPNTDLVTSIVHQNISILYDFSFDYQYRMTFSCYVDNECDLNYARQVINKFTSVNYQPLSNSLAPLLYNSAANNVSECYEGDIPITCTNGVCTSIVSKGVSLNRTCVISIATVVGIDIARIRVFPGPSPTDGDGFIVFCNRDRCNSPDAENSVHSTIHNYNSLLDIIEPSTTTPTTTPHVPSTTSHGNQVTAAHNGCVIILLSIGTLCQYFQKYLYY